MKKIIDQIFECDFSKEFMHYPEYKEMYIDMKPDFSKISFEDNREQIETSILEYQDRARLTMTIYYFLKYMNLDEKVDDLESFTLNFKDNNTIEFYQKIDKSFNGDVSESLELCDTIANKFWQRFLMMNELVSYYVNNVKDKYVINELKNFYTLGYVIYSYFLSWDLLQYMELANKDKTVERYIDMQLYEKLRGYANFYLSETEKYTELYNKIMIEKYFKKKLVKK